VSGVRAVMAAWRWVLALWIGELVIAVTSGTAVRAQVAAALGGFVLPDDHLMYAVAELVGFHPQILLAIILGILGSAAVATLAWCLLAPAVLLRLARGPQPAAVLGGAWASRVAPALATTGWHLLLRAGVGFVLIGGVAPLPPTVALVILALALVVTTAALDISRSAVVLHGAAGSSIRTALWGYVHAAKHPRLLGALTGLQLLQWACGLVGLAIALRSGGDAIGWARLLALVGTAVGLLRLRHVACAGAMPTPP
jgi:hypothetical protein